MSFRVEAPYKPTGDQPQAIEKLVHGVQTGQKHQTLLGATATGKSLGYHDPIYIIEERDGERTARVHSIGPLIDTLMSDASAVLAQVGDSDVLDRSALDAIFYVQAFDPATGGVALFPVQSFTRHTPTAQMYRLRTACGRSATLTSDHNLWVLRNGRLTLIETGDARQTDYIPLPETLLAPGELTNFDLLAYTTAEQVYVHAGDVVRAFDAAGGSAAIRHSIDASGISGAAKLSALRGRHKGTGIADARTKRLPEFWPDLPLPRCMLLRAYFDGDGTVDRASAVTATTASEALASDLAYALLRYGIWARIRKVWKRATNTEHAGNWYFTVTLSGQRDLRRFHESIGFGEPHKRTALLRQFDRDSHPNVDVVPIAGTQLRTLREALNLSADVIAADAGLSRSALQLIETGKRRPQRPSLVALLDTLAAWSSVKPVDAAWWASWQELHGLCNLRWTSIAELTPIVYAHPFVYDLTVPGAETFLAGQGGMFVHNTFVMAKIFEQVQRPTLVLAHNKTLVSQLWAEFRDFLPDAAVEMFISYYDEYTPEAYVPSKDLYIEKEASINEEIDRLRHAATQALFTRQDVLIVASVSAIFGLGSPHDYGQVVISLRQGEVRNRDKLLRQLIDLQFERNDIDFHRGTFRVRGDTLDVVPANSEIALRIEFWGDEIERISEFDPLTGEILTQRTNIDIYPAKHFVTTKDKLNIAVRSIQDELGERLRELETGGKVLEAARLKQRTMYDLEMLGEIGYCSGIENYSRHMDARLPGQTPWTLIDYFPDDFLLFVDESHITVSQVRGMHTGDQQRKLTLVDYGFRLPSALDNRPLRFDEFETHIHQIVFVSATPGPYERQHSEQIVEQIIRPTGLVDPMITIKPTKGQVDDLVGEVRKRVEKGQRALVTTLTKRMAEDLADYLKEMGIRTHYLHADIDTIERIEILRDLRLGVYDVVVGINLLREGLDLPEVSLVAVLDADKEGFLRSETSLIQIIGRAARHIEGTVIMYADTVTRSMDAAIKETQRRRDIQIAHNKRNNIVPVGISKQVRDLTDRLRKAAEERGDYVVNGKSVTAGPSGGVIRELPRDELVKLVKDLEKQMKQAAKDLEFEKAASLRDQIVELRKTMALDA
ncbi:excinuclease ABC subunit UvrB [Candidatus Gracilibacteria bacterium]|nr:excinuclease ABC subunit UvrB [Candidatus Gracilibacteria bacterium]